jgi:TM2 domain-containing membrane protein YozV
MNLMDYKSSGISYGLWFLCLIGFCGIHRFYNGKWITGIIWLLTGGLLFIGQFIDLFLIPGMVDRENARRREILRREGHL